MKYRIFLAGILKLPTYQPLHYVHAFSFNLWTAVNNAVDNPQCMRRSMQCLNPSNQNSNFLDLFLKYKFLYIFLLNFNHITLTRINWASLRNVFQMYWFITSLKIRRIIYKRIFMLHQGAVKSASMYQTFKPLYLNYLLFQHFVRLFSFLI